MRYLFKHVLMRDVAYEMQLGRHLRHMHHKATEAIKTLHRADLTLHYVDLAYHYRQAELPEQERHYAILAGKQAAADYANDQAVRLLSRALELTPQRDLLGRYDLLSSREKVYGRQGSHQPQAQDLDRLHELAERLNDDKKRAETRTRQASYAYTMGDFSKANAAAQQAIQLARDVQDSRLEAQAYLQSCRTLIRQGKPAEAQQRASSALALAQAAGLQKLEANSLYNLAVAALYQGDYTQARLNAQRAQQIYRQIGERIGETQALNVLGSVEGTLGDYAQAIIYFDQVLQTSREIGNLAGQATLLHNLGMIADYLGDYQQAKTYLEHALSTRQKVNDLPGTALTLGTLSLPCHHLGEHALAYEWSQSATSLAEEIGDRFAQGYALTSQGRALEGLGKLERATNTYQRALKASQDLNMPNLDPLAGLVRIALAQNRLSQAQVYVEELLDHIARNPKLGGAEEPLRAYWSCVQALRAANDPRAQEVLDSAYHLLQARAAKISDPTMRSSFLENVAVHRDILAAWQESVYNQGGK